MNLDKHPSSLVIIVNSRLTFSLFFACYQPSYFPLSFHWNPRSLWKIHHRNREYHEQKKQFSSMHVYKHARRYE